MVGVRNRRRGALVGAVFGCFLMAPASAAAQAVYGSYEHATDNVDVVFLGGNLPLGGNVGGFTPYVGFGSYWLSYERADGEDASVTALTPLVGLRHGFGNGASVSGSVGYKFQSSNEEDPLPFFGGGGDGISTTLSAGYWGSAPINADGQVSYNWGSEYVWSRVRASMGIASRTRLGAELTVQGETGNDDGYSSVAYGPFVSFGLGNGWSIGAGAGWKNDTGPDSHNYFGVDFAWNRPG